MQDSFYTAQASIDVLETLLTGAGAFDAVEGLDAEERRHFILSTSVVLAGLGTALQNAIIEQSHTIPLPRDVYNELRLISAGLTAAVDAHGSAEVFEERLRAAVEALDAEAAHE